MAAVCPHAGWVYSGKTAGLVFSSIEPKELYIIIGPNHRGTGAPAALMESGEWQTPLGSLKIDGAAAGELIKKCPTLSVDNSAHLAEHSIEVQAPFIKYISPEAMIVPIALYDYSAKTCMEIGKAVGETIKGRSAMVIASSDMSHYIQADEAEKMDRLAINKILALDPQGLLETVEKNDISMCGSGPVAAALWSALHLGAKKGRLLDYRNSGDTTGDYAQVVGYAGIAVY